MHDGGTDWSLGFGKKAGADPRQLGSLTPNGEGPLALLSPSVRLPLFQGPRCPSIGRLGGASNGEAGCGFRHVE